MRYRSSTPLRISRKVENLSLRLRRPSQAHSALASLIQSPSAPPSQRKQAPSRVQVRSSQFIRPVPGPSRPSHRPQQQNARHPAHGIRPAQLNPPPLSPSTFVPVALFPTPSRRVHHSPLTDLSTTIATVPEVTASRKTIYGVASCTTPPKSPHPQPRGRQITAHLPPAGLLGSFISALSFRTLALPQRTTQPAYTPRSCLLLGIDYSLSVLCLHCDFAIVASRSDCARRPQPFACKRAIVGTPKHDLRLILPPSLIEPVLRAPRGLLKRGAASTLALTARSSTLR